MARKKIRPSSTYRRPLNINIGIIVFLIFFVYILFNIFNYFRKENPQIYEVGQVGTAVKDNTYDGLILRTELVHTTSKAGYVNIYVRENARASVGETIYSIDENGSYTQMLQSNAAGSSSLSTDQLNSLKKKLAAFSASYNPASFSNVYDAKYGVENLLMSYLSADSLEKLGEMGIDTSYLTTVAAEESGIVEYMQDGMETLKEEDLTADSFNRSNYQVNTVSAGSMMEKNSFVYKTINSESWTLYLPLTSEDQDALREESKVALHFNDVNLDVSADFTMITTSDGVVLGKCSLSRYMIQLADRRFTSVTLKKSNLASLSKSGLKIPKSSIVTKDFYVIPEGYATKGDNNSSEIGFIREVYTAQGTQAVMIYPDIYAHYDGYYYIDEGAIEGGTVLKMPENPLYESSDLEAALAVSNEDPDNYFDEKASREAAEGEDAEGEEDGEDTSDEEDGEDAEEEGASSEEESTTEETTTEEETVAYNPDLEMGSDSATQEAAASAEGEDGDSSEESSAANVVAMPQTRGSYTIGEKQPLKGALCVNKGYAVFKQTQILDETDDYYIVASGQSYGLAVFDHILLSGTSANEGDLIY